jgi:hypothetical protein
LVLRHLIQHPQEILFELTRHGAALKMTDSQRDVDPGQPAAPSGR